MINRYMVVVSYSDRSGIIQAFGPYLDQGAAEEAKERLPEAMPVLENTGLWEVVVCTDVETEGRP